MEIWRNNVDYVNFDSFDKFANYFIIFIKRRDQKMHERCIVYRCFLSEF